jgi:hypothetical protein
MPKILKAKRRKAKTKEKIKAKAKAKAKIKPITRTKEKAQKKKIKKKAKIEVGTMRENQPLKLPDKAKRDETLPAAEQTHAATVERNDQRDAEVLPKISFKLEVDGRLKSEHPTQEAALTVARELKRKFPQIRVAVVDAKGQRALQ